MITLAALFAIPVAGASLFLGACWLADRRADRQEAEALARVTARRIPLDE